MIPQEVIRRKRNGESLDGADIAAFILGLTDGSISEGQVAAFAMAVWFSGMSLEETVALTLAMRDSGDVLSFADIGRPVADKHSTGGVGDNVSPDAGADRGGMRARRADDFRPWPWPYRRHARQAGINSRLRYQTLRSAVSPDRRGRRLRPSSARPPISHPPTGAYTPSAT